MVVGREFFCCGLQAASGPLVKNFNTWDCGTLIDKYGSKFYHGEPAKTTLALVKTDRGWQIATE